MTPKTFNNLKEKSFQNRFDIANIRIEKLKKLSLWIKNNETQICQALQTDFNKPEFETQVSEILIVQIELKYFIQNLKSWMKDKSVSTPLTLIGHKSQIRFENKGVILIISPWNYPFQLAINPLIAAIAAGNTVVIKPSELTPATSNLISELCKTIFTNDVVVELGDKHKTNELLNYQFDHVFFTGSTAVGRIIATKCAEKLIPYTLELGGKSPVIIDETADLDDAVQKIHWAKYLNRGQTCVAPDYILVQTNIYSEFMNKYKEKSEKFKTDNISHIITEHHELRLIQMTLNKLKSTELISIQNTDHPLMQDEIFGPVSPVLSFDDVDQAVEIIKKHADPLAFYIFSKSDSNIDDYLRKIPSGGAGINAISVHLGNHHLPFGGRGNSGQGRYHGYFGFLEFSHQRAIIRQYFFSQITQLIFPPYTPFKNKILKILKFMNS